MLLKSWFYPCFAWSAVTRWLVIGCGCVWLIACSSTGPAPPKDEAVDLRLQVVASKDVNPDDSGRASPIMVRVYELKSGTTFRSADFFSLQDDDRKAMGDDVLASDEFILRPGETKTIERHANPSTKLIGVLAGYRNLGKSAWRDVHAFQTPAKTPWYRRMFKHDEKEMLTVRVNKRAVSILVKRGDKWVYAAQRAD